MFKPAYINDPHDLPLGEGEQYFGNYPAMDNGTHTYWLLACLPVVKFVAVFIACAGWFAAEYRGLVWRDRLSRAILRLHDELFGCAKLHITSYRLVLTAGGEPPVNYRLTEVAGVETSPQVLKGNFFIHFSNRQRPVGLWILDRQQVALIIQSAARS